MLESSTAVGISGGITVSATLVPVAMMIRVAAKGKILLVMVLLLVLAEFLLQRDDVQPAILQSIVDQVGFAAVFQYSVAGKLFEVAENLNEIFRL